MTSSAAVAASHRRLPPPSGAIFLARAAAPAPTCVSASEEASAPVSGTGVEPVTGRRCDGMNAAASYDGGRSVVMISSGVGRPAGSFVRHCPISGARSDGTPARSASSCTTW